MTCWHQGTWLFMMDERGQRKDGKAPKEKGNAAMEKR